MTKYRKKPVEVEAWQFNDAFQTAPDWVIEAVKNGTISVVPDMYPAKEENRTVHLFIKTLEGEMCAEPHDYIIQGVKGELYPCKPDIFEKTYEVIDHPLLKCKGRWSSVLEEFIASGNSCMKHDYRDEATKAYNGLYGANDYRFKRMIAVKKHGSKIYLIRKDLNNG